jgi:hypothetical protein
MGDWTLADWEEWDAEGTAEALAAGEVTPEWLEKYGVASLLRRP